MHADRRSFLGAAALTAGGLFASDSHAAEDRRGGKTKMAVNVEMWFRKVQPFHKRLEESARLGFDAVELWPWRGKDLNAIADTCQRLKLTIAQFTAWGFSPGLNETKNHNHFVEEVEASCEVAKKWGVKLLCVVGGNDVRGMSQQQMHENIITGLKKGAPVAEKHGITLILEPMNIRIDHKGHCLYGSEAGVRITRAVGSPNVKVLFDLYHNEISEGDLCGHLKDGFDQLGYVQIADNPGRHEPGTGEIHFPRVLRQLYELGYRGYVGLEHTPSKSEEIAAEANRKADNWV